MHCSNTAEGGLCQKNGAARNATLYDSAQRICDFILKSAANAEQD
jgi:hypothetical protein